MCEGVSRDFVHHAPKDPSGKRSDESYGKVMQNALPLIGALRTSIRQP